MLNRENVMAVAIDSGLILLIEPDGNIGSYRQRGIGTLSETEIRGEIERGRLDQSWGNYRELPKEYSIYFEDTAIMGRAVATYPLVLAKRREKYNR